MLRQYYTYIMANRYNNVLYIGVTNDLKRRAYEHKGNEVKGFTAKYKVNKLVYFEAFEDINDAISREKQIKSGSRKKKLKLVDGFNEEWIDLSYCIG
jgi:putative endonuclease